MPFIPKDSVLSTGACNRIAIIGPPGSGKSTSLLTFPNLVVFDRDKNSPSGIHTIPAWNPDWANNLAKPTNRNAPPNFRDATLRWLTENAPLFEPDQTFAIDSWTFLQEAFDLYTYYEDDLMPVNPKTNQKDGYFFWAQKLKFSKKVMELLKSMKCNVVVILHETIDRDNEGRVTGKIRPVQDGAYKDVLLGGFNNVWRMRSFPKNTSKGLAPRSEDGSKKDQELRYFWQLFGDSVVDLKMDAKLGHYCRANHIKEVDIEIKPDGSVIGGFQTIQEIYGKIMVSPVSVENKETKEERKL